MRRSLLDRGCRVEIQVAAVYEHSAGWRWRRGRVDHFNLWLALEGRGFIETGGRVHEFSAGSMFLIPPGWVVDGNASGVAGMTNFTVHFRGDARTEAWLEAMVRTASPAHLRHFIWASHLCRHLSEVFYRRPVEGAGMMLSGLELLLRSMEYVHTLPPDDPCDHALIEIVERIRRNPAATYTVGEMAALARLSEAQFTRRFKVLTGFAPNRFLIEERLERAESYLRETDMRVEEIAERLGYRDVYFFSRQFRRFRGMSPTGVRRSQGAQGNRSSGR